MTLVKDWQKLWRSWSIIAALVGAVLPELLQIIADNTDLLPGLTSGDKSGIRIICLLLVVIVRPIQQTSLIPKDPA